MGDLRGRGVGGAEPLCSAADVEEPLLAGNCAVTEEAGAQAGTPATKSTSRLLQKRVPVTVSRPTDYSLWKRAKLPITVPLTSTPQRSDLMDFK